MKVKKLTKLLVTMYEDYPIFEPAEGGYYYAGREVVPLEDNEFSTVAEAYAAIAEMVDDLREGRGEPWEIDRTAEEVEECLLDWINEDGAEGGSITVARKTTKYIGDGVRFVIETPATYQSDVRGWHPYE